MQKPRAVLRLAVKPATTSTLRRQVAGLLAVLMTTQATGCTSWRTVQQPWPLTFDSTRAKPKVQVVLEDGTRLRADSGHARTNTLLLHYRSGATDTIPQSQVGKIQTRQFNPLKTAALGILALLAAGLAVATVLCADGCINY